MDAMINEPTLANLSPTMEIWSARRRHVSRFGDVGGRCRADGRSESGDNEVRGK